MVKQEDVTSDCRITTTKSMKWAKEIELRPGLKMILTDYTFPDYHAFDFDITIAPLIFCFILSGTASSTIFRGSRKDTLIEGRACTHYISSFPKTKGVSEFPANQPLQMLHIQMDPWLLGVLIQSEMDHFPKDFRSLAESSGNNHYFCQGAMTASMQVIVSQILTYSSHSPTRLLFLESKALELIALQLEQSILAPCEKERIYSLSSAEIEQLYEARNIVTENMLQPLSLSEIARRTGLNEFKLKRGFRQLFGTTVFGFLRQIRMEHARLLLEDGCMNVKEISWAVGYNDPGRFSDAFKRQYGLRPSALLTQKT